MNDSLVLAWNRYSEAESDFDFSSRHFEYAAENLEAAQKELDRLLETPEQRKLDKIRRIVDGHPYVCPLPDAIRYVIDGKA